MFIPGGHSPLVDLAHDATLHALAARHDAAGKVIAAVCHGPAALVHARRANGQPFFQGRRITGFTNAEKFLALLKNVVPFPQQDETKISGVNFHSALLPMRSHCKQDCHLITGQNPNTSEAVAKALVEAPRWALSRETRAPARRRWRLGTGSARAAGPPAPCRGTRSVACGASLTGGALGLSANLQNGKDLDVRTDGENGNRKQTNLLLQATCRARPSSA